MRHPAVAEVAVIGLPHPRWGEAVTALVIPAPGAEANAEALIAHCRGEIAGYKVPKTVLFVSDLPRTPSGKVQKAVLRRQYADAAT